MPMSGKEAGEKALRGLQDALNDMGSKIEEQGKLRAPVRFNKLRESITKDPRTGAKEDKAHPGRWVVQVYTGPQTKSYAAVQHEGWIGYHGDVHVKAHTRRTKTGKTFTVREHIRKTPIFLNPRHGGGKNYLRGPLTEQYPLLGKLVAEKVKRRLSE